MFTLMVSISGDERAIEDIRGLSSSLVGRGHPVAIFFTGDGVKHLKAVEEMAEISSMGVRLLACRTSLRERGIEPEEGLPKGVETSSLGMLVELLEACERAIFL